MDPANLLVLVMVAMAAAVVARRPSPIAGRLVLIAGLAYIGSAHLFGRLEAMPSLIQKMYSVTHISAANAAWPMAYLVMAVAVGAIACLVFAQVRALEARPAEALLAGWALAAGLASIVAMGWSPTVHASGSRTQFVGTVVLVVLACRIGMEFRRVYGPTAAGSAAAAVAILAACRVVALAS